MNSNQNQENFYKIKRNLKKLNNQEDHLIMLNKGTSLKYFLENKPNFLHQKFHTDFEVDKMKSTEERKPFSNIERIKIDGNVLFF